MGSASKLLVLLAAPLPLPSAVRLAPRSVSAAFPCGRSLASSSQRARPGFAVRGAAEAHSLAAGTRVAYGEAAASFASSSPAHPWPEWPRLIDFLFAGGYRDRRVSAAVEDGDDDSWVAGEEPTEDFAKAAEACLLFARERPELLRSLEKKDIEIIVDKGSPFLFKNGANSTRRLKSFISGDGNSVLESQSVKTFDIMRYLLSYACKPFSSKDEEFIKVRQHIEKSVRRLLAELVNVSTAGEESASAESTANSTSLSQQLARPPGQNFEMKRGDWICRKCSFLNFARNMKCFECNDSRPKRVLTGGEWECPQCDFYNYGRNMSCLRCDFKRPGEAPKNIAAGRGWLYNRSSTVQNNAYQGNGLNGMESNANSESSISQRLDSIFGRSSILSGINQQVSPSDINGTGNPSEYRKRIPSQRKDSDHVPFVPLPKDMFSNAQNANSDILQVPLKEDSASSPHEPTVKRFEGKDADSSDMAEKWSQKVAELDNTSDLANSASDDDFPEIMPMRKGENRFVISKKKDRSLTSPQYKRRIALEQANSSSFVPFVPFPPDYFTKKDKNPEASSTNDSASEGLTTHEKSQTVPVKLQDNKTEASEQVSSGTTSQLLKTPAINQSNSRSSIANSSEENLSEGKAGAVYKGATTASVGTPGNSWSNSNRSGNDEHSFSRHESDSATAKFRQSESPQSATDESKPSLGRKSLEGSLVKEPDPLDMSEEAKAARWFRRVAQIKDISELSNIPDEDFPEIMPMRKGVNRFVVSKRKTPLERRLTSSHYRKNLPVIKSDPDESAT
ncbi:hypothetical protein Cni_G27494 [Canna indica]|uniref:RanBP2-type domain-containing protein n=1 Tax=Canna indica TaxID=4628 RepID=A0AAQ3L3X2_9LILI|nr:hypothetical protein Cni_G27494 [Canna indica]